MWHPVLKEIAWSSISKNGSGRFSFPRICILVYLHYFPLRQTDHRDPGRLSGSGMHQPPTFTCRDAVGSWREERGESWYGEEAKYSIWLNWGKNVTTTPPPCIMGRSGDSRGLPGIISWGSVQFPGQGWQVISQWSLGSEPRGQRAQGAAILHWHRRVEALGTCRCLQEDTELRDVVQKRDLFWERICRWIGDY